MDHLKRLLVIDDEQDLLDMLQFEFNAKGYTVRLAHNGVEALECLSHYNPDLIILDINMPQMGGIEFYNHICDDKGHPKFPVFILTARANIEDLFKQFEVLGFMAKPFELGDLVRNVDVAVHSGDDSASMLLKKSFQMPSPKVCIVDDDLESVKPIIFKFIQSGYSVHWADSGFHGIERVVANQPQIVCVRLDLKDIQGDMVVMKLRNFPHTKNMHYLLYTHNPGKDEKIAVKICSKTGVDKYVQTDSPAIILDAVNHIFIENNLLDLR